jgi:hypothetical protein
MNWDEVLDRLREAGLEPVEDIYMENYGKVLAAQRAEFSGRHFRCAYGVIRATELRIEIFLFPSEGHLQEFLEVIGDDPRWVSRANVLLHLPESDPATLGTIVEALSSRVT